MRKLLLSFLLLVTSFVLNITFPVYASHNGGNSCSSLPEEKIPAALTRLQASNKDTDPIKLRIHWEQLDQDTFDTYYENGARTFFIDIVAEGQDKPSSHANSEIEMPDFQEVQEIELTDIAIPNEADNTQSTYTMSVYIRNPLDQTCHLEANKLGFTYTTDLNSDGTCAGGSTKKRGASCDPNQQIEGSCNICPSDAKCERNNDGDYKCGGGQASPPTATPTVPAGRPPCVEGVDENGDTIRAEPGQTLSGYVKCTKVTTAIGHISTDPKEFIGSIFGVVLGISGGLAVLIIIYAGYRLITSQGNPDGIKGARELLTAAIVGLLFIIFSIVLLEVIGVDILRIPGFSADRGNRIQVNNPDPNAACVQSPGSRGGACPDGSGNYACGYCTADTGCPLCSPVIDCRTSVYSIASCSGGGFRCTSDDQCKNHRSSCPPGQVGLMACQNGGCVTVSCRIIKNTNKTP